jgi:prepilin peptidase CpaA
MTPAHQFILIGLALCAIAAVFDLRTGRIPNELTLVALALAPLSHALSAWRLDGTLESALGAAGLSVLGMAIGAAIPLLLFRAGAMGGGDVKLFAAVGAVTSPIFVAYAQTYAFAFAAVQGLLLVARDKRTLRAVLGNVGALLTSPIRKKEARQPVDLESMTSIRLALSVFLGSSVAAWVAWK